MGSQRSKTIGDWPVIEAIEPRLLFSAGWNVALIDGSLPEADQLVCAAAQADLIHVYDGSSETAAEVLSHVSALAQAAVMKIDSVSILSHGAPSRFALGNEYVSTETLADQASAWSELASSLAPGANIYIFGCNLAGLGGEGQDLLDRLDNLTGADVFASDDLTGTGGDWVLEAASSGADAQAAGIVSTPFDIHMLTEWGGTLDLVASTEFPVNTVTADDQLAASVAMDDDGNFVIAWQSKGQDNLDGKSGIYAQLFDANGVAQGGEFLVNTTTADDQEKPSVAMDDDGNFVIAWESTGQDNLDGESGVYAQRYDASGVAQGGEFLVNTTTADDQKEASVAMDDDGNFVIAWESKDQDDPDGKSGIYAQLFDANGVAQGSEFMVNTTTPGDQEKPSVAMDADGNFVIAWASKGQDDLDGKKGVYAQRYDASGVAQGGEFLVNTTTADDQKEASVAMDDDGNFVIAWESTGQDDLDGNSGVYAQRYNASGVAQGGEFLVNTTTGDDQKEPSAAMDDGGNFVIAWESKGQDDLDGDSGVYAQLFDANGVAQGDEFLVNTTTADDQEEPSVAMDDDGNFAIAWESKDQDDLDGESGVYARRYTVPVVTSTGGSLSTEQVWAWFSYQSQMEATASSTPSTTEAGNTYSLTGGGDDDTFATDSSAGETTASDQAALDSQTDLSSELTGEVEDSGQPTGDAADTTGLNDGNEQTAIDDQGLANIAANAAKPGGPVEPKRGQDTGSQKAAIRKAARGRVAESSVIAKLARGIKQMMAKSPSVIELARGLNQITESPAFAGLSQGLNQILAESSTVVEAIRTNLPMRRQLESMKRKMARAAGLQKRREKIIVGTTTGVTISFAAGYVIWTCRGGSMLASFLSAMPMWKWFDPLPVLSSWGKNHKQRKSDKHKASANDSDDVKNLFESKGRA